MGIGNAPLTGAARPVDGSGTGDSSTTSFAMGFTPVSANHVLVFIDGVRQVSTADYSVSGSNCIFTSAPVTGEQLDFYSFEVGKETIPQDGSIDADKINSATLNPIVQIVRTDDSVVNTGTTVIPWDNTIPQNTEGDEYITVSITPKSATNKLIIESSVSIDHDGAGRLVVALFKDSIADALKTSFVFTDAGKVKVMHISYEVVAGSTSSQTFKIRAGNGVAGTTTFNGDAGTAKYGGTINSFIKVTEVVQ